MGALGMLALARAGELRSTRRRRELTFPAKYGREKWISLLLWLNLATPARARQGEHPERGNRFPNALRRLVR